MAAILDFWSERFELFLTYKSPRCFPPSLQSNGFLVEEAKNRFSRWRPWQPSWISDQDNLAIFDLQVTPMLPIEFGVDWPFCSGEEAKNRFSRWRPWRPSWIFDRNEFSYFWSTSHPDASYQVSSQLVSQSTKQKRKIYFQDGRHLGFPIKTILAFFYLQVTPMLPTKFKSQ